jgi:hypothetical protein
MRAGERGQDAVEHRAVAAAAVQAHDDLAARQVGHDLGQGRPADVVHVGRHAVDRGVLVGHGRRLPAR